MNTTTARIYADADTYQDVQVEYSGSSRWFEKYTVDYCRVLTPLEIEPSDLHEDVCVAIAEDMRRAVRIEVEIEVNQLETV